MAKAKSPVTLHAPPVSGESWYELHASCTEVRAEILINQVDDEVVHFVRTYTGRRSKAKLSRFDGKIGNYARTWRKV